MYSIIYKLLKYAKDTNLQERIQDMSDEAKKRVKLKINRQELDNLIDPDEGRYPTEVKSVYFDPEE